MTDQGEACPTKVPWTHRGLLHWFTSCLHYSGRREVVVPGHGIVNDRRRPVDGYVCCGCGQKDEVSRGY